MSANTNVSTPARPKRVLMSAANGAVSPVTQWPVGVLLAFWRSPIRQLVTIIIEVAVMTWVLMPRLTRWLARWIYPSVRTT